MKSRVATILRILRQCQGHQHQHPTLTLQLGQGITREMHSGQLCWIHLLGKPCLSGLNFSFSCKIQSLGISKHGWFSTFPRSLAGKSSGGCCGGAAALLGRFPPGGDVFCQIILLYRFITAIKAKPSLTMHQIQGNSLKVHSEPVSTAVCLSIHDWRRVIAFGKLAGGGE